MYDLVLRSRLTDGGDFDFIARILQPCTFHDSLGHFLDIILPLGTLGRKIEKS